MARPRSERTIGLPANTYLNTAGYYYFRRPMSKRTTGLGRDKDVAMEAAASLNSEVNLDKNAKLMARVKVAKNNYRLDKNGLVELSYLQNNASIFSIVSGIYFLLLHDEVIYVGQSQNCNYRISVHISERKKEFNRCYIVQADPEVLDRLEAMYIHKFKPVHNISMPNLPRGDVWDIEQKLQNKQDIF